MRPFFFFRWRRRGRPWGWHEAGRWRRLVRLTPMREEEEGGRLGREVSWAGREAEAQWGRGGMATAGPKVWMGRLAAGPVGPKVRKNSFPNKI
jgi:hypothetical protein